MFNRRYSAHFSRHILPLLGLGLITLVQHTFSQPFNFQDFLKEDAKKKFNLQTEQPLSEIRSMYQDMTKSLSSVRLMLSFALYSIELEANQLNQENQFRSCTIKKVSTPTDKNVLDNDDIDTKLLLNFVNGLWDLNNEEYGRAMKNNCFTATLNDNGQWIQTHRDFTKYKGAGHIVKLPECLTADTTEIH
ncbi:MAG: hypothetical protein OXE99_10730 [Cellvibrionales bacterium]|nr:hypothetical protein [Cellvibrionales bacterium]